MNIAKLAKTAKLLAEKSPPKPVDWPANPYDKELEKLREQSKGTFSGFIEAIKSGAAGQPNKELSLWLNKKIVDLRDKQILEYLRNKGIQLDVGNTQ